MSKVLTALKQAKIQANGKALVLKLRNHRRDVDLKFNAMKKRFGIS